ncbi:archaemetzincin [Flavobacterium reichenbachii]|uniref:Zn-dependent protease n=1 Tax=Flavobacterium reichenbachii TaxID=362418 RepID=A0A085ZP60_9FLAO|nr:archaemetzincin [Flavobacterium reichenbachii]KFF06224.1 Zn-dependent protease [Flavobacterium reichenbachii]OXB17560.1 Zn-dependent protease [Flavobacterium reichenbachii]
MRKLSLFILVLLFACKSDKKNHYFDAVKDNDVALFPPAPGEWLYEHKEKGQTFEQFLKTKHVVPTKEQNVIYIQPIGKFNVLQTKQIDLTRAYLEIFFQLKTKILETKSNDIIPSHVRRIGGEGQEQFLAGYILDSILIKQKPSDRIALMGLTEVDLYPKPEWNFVFGLASYSQKTGVSSIFRLQDGELTEANFNKCLDRLLKICSHEIGHMFGLHHCTAADCVMNGTNSLSETDKHTVRLCSVCQRKLNSGIKYNNAKRLADLEKYFKANNLKESAALMHKDLESIQ